MIDYSFPIEELEYFLLIMTRISCFVFVAPFFSISSTPGRVKIGFSFFLSVLIYYATMPHVYVSGGTDDLVGTVVDWVSPKTLPGSYYHAAVLDLDK